MTAGKELPADGANTSAGQIPLNRLAIFPANGDQRLVDVGVGKAHVNPSAAEDGAGPIERANLTTQFEVGP